MLRAQRGGASGQAGQRTSRAKPITIRHLAGLISYRHPERLTHLFFDDSDRVSHPPENKKAADWLPRKVLTRMTKEKGTKG